MTLKERVCVCVGVCWCNCVCSELIRPLMKGLFIPSSVNALSLSQPYSVINTFFIYAHTRAHARGEREGKRALKEIVLGVDSDKIFPSHAHTQVHTHPIHQYRGHARSSHLTFTYHPPSHTHANTPLSSAISRWVFPITFPFLSREGSISWDKLQATSFTIPPAPFKWFNFFDLNLSVNTKTRECSHLVAHKIEFCSSRPF